jgi:hypothetical protein
MNNQIVIARYNENLEWTKFLKSETIIYNKGSNVGTKHKTIKLPNIGMGGATFWYHIIENYDNLADITLFIQGWPFDASFESHLGLKSDENGVNFIEEFYFTLLDEHVASYNCLMDIIGDKYSCPTNYNVRRQDNFIYNSVDWKLWIDNYIDPTSKIDFYKPNRFYKSGQISLKKEIIKSNSKEYYIKLMEHWKYKFPIAEWLVESTMSQMFNISNDGTYEDFRHDLVDVSNLDDYKKWMYEINE